MSTSDPTPIADYGYIADCHSAALVSRAGSIDWCCMPRLDSKSCFGRLLGWKTGGYCQIVPSCRHETSRRYLEGTLVLETTFRTDDGEARLYDCFTMRKEGEHRPHQQILRIVEGLRGTVPFDAAIVPRLDYGSIKPWIRQVDGQHYVAIGGSDGLFISGDLPVRMKHRHDLEGHFTVDQGDRVRLSVLWRRPEDLDEGQVTAPAVESLERRFQETLEWWQAWSGHCTYDGPYSEAVRQSAVVLKGLSNAPTGAIAGRLAELGLSFHVDPGFMFHRPLSGRTRLRQ